MKSEGVVLYHTIKKMNCTYALSAKSDEDVQVSKCLYFDPNSNGKTLWNELLESGSFHKNLSSKFDNIYGEMGVAIAAQTRLEAGDTKDVEMSLVWDMPVVSFPRARRKFTKFYTKYFGSSDATLKIVDYCFKQYKTWEKDIYSYQKRVLLDE